MRLLLDTQVFLWSMYAPARLTAALRAAIGSPVNVVAVSAATVWEIAIKVAMAKLQVEPADVDQLPELIDAAGFDELPVRARHAAGVRALPLHHRDPFDRLLIAQARAEGFTVVTIDPAFRAYDIPLLQPA
jgi:PIN domain nuclease of toxin-antitoxin system